MRDQNDELISSLSYKNPTSASYIIRRNSSTFHCVGGNIYTPNAGARFVKFYLTAEDRYVSNLIWSVRTPRLQKH